ncbi:hypothetical protein RRG08_007388 [Elysia crispata]|uniref:Uncharacterized protein n=1 Tax=Elysia crispata TaxID=231223 RepID=A0AAE1E497_9GAST|nr:hypothetical protein RRG08_007388 [Elysia crispata]
MSATREDIERPYQVLLKGLVAGVKRGPPKGSRYRNYSCRALASFIALIKGPENASDNLKVMRRRGYSKATPSLTKRIPV